MAIYPNHSIPNHHLHSLLLVLCLYAHDSPLYINHYKPASKSSWGPSVASEHPHVKPAEGSGARLRCAFMEHTGYVQCWWLNYWISYISIIIELLDKLHKYNYNWPIGEVYGLIIYNTISNWGLICSLIHTGLTCQWEKWTMLTSEAWSNLDIPNSSLVEKTPPFWFVDLWVKTNVFWLKSQFVWLKSWFWWLNP